jgi:hypothetical protein
VSPLLGYLLPVGAGFVGVTGSSDASRVTSAEDEPARAEPVGAPGKHHRMVRLSAGRPSDLRGTIATRAIVGQNSHCAPLRHCLYSSP